MQTKAIAQKRQEALELLQKELEIFGSFKRQYKNLKAFRQDLCKFCQWSFFDKFLCPKATKIPSGDLLDHHCVGYFAPFEFKRKSWGWGIALCVGAHHTLKRGFSKA